MKNFLEEIVQAKKKEIAIKKSRSKGKIFAKVEKYCPHFTTEFKDRLKKKGLINCIGEIKKYSPSKGLLRENFNPLEIAQAYHQLKIAAISVLTDERYFQGKPEYIRQVKSVTNIPVLRKDFIIDPYQIYEAKDFGADAILLIVKMLSLKQLREFIQIAGSLSLDCLVEVHTNKEIEYAVQADAQIIGINNRDLETFKTDINLSLTLVDSIPAGCIKVSESAFNSGKDIQVADQAGFDAVLIGEQFMRSTDITKTYKELFLNK